MARTPSMTTAECEAILGRRGHLYVDANNHSVARKWLTASGVKGLYAAGLARKLVSVIYNDISDIELNKARDMANAAASEYSEEEVTSPDVPDAIAMPDADDTGRAQQLAKLLGEMLKSPSVDAAQVESIINQKWAELPELIAKHSPITRIEIIREDKSAFQIEGRVHPKFADLLKACASRMLNGFAPNITIVGPTGSGKTHAVEQAAKALGREFYTNGALSMDHQLIGYKDANGNYHETAFRQGFSRPAVYLFDEVDSSDNSPLLAMAGALANGASTFPDGRIERHPDSVIIAAGNTWGLGATADFVGRNKLDGAIRSRFPVRIHWEYDEKLERDISGNVDWAIRVQKARHNAKRAGLKVIIDPRMSQAGAALIAQGYTSDEAASVTYLADLSKEQRDIIEN